MNHTDIHPKFLLNGLSFKKDDLKELAYNFIKEGEPHEKDMGQFLSDWLSKNDTLEVFTSGSTGSPKKITLKKKYMINSALATGSFFGLAPGNKALLCLSAKYIAGKMMLVRAMVLGLQLDVIPSNSKPLSTTPEQYDFVAMVPLQLENSIDELHRIDQLIVGGAPMSISLKNRVQVKNIRIYETYGMTETSTHIAVKSVNFEKNVSSSRDKEVFKTLPNVKVSVDSRNCLVINAPEICDIELVTNDMVNLISATEFEWLGRYDSIINSGGIKLIPEQIEKELAPLVFQRFFVACLPDASLGEKLVLIIEGNVDKERLMVTIKNESNLSKFQIPKTIFTLPKFMETENGKLDRVKTIEMVKN